jgi:myosin-5
MTTMGSMSPSRRTEQVLADAQRKVSNAEEAIEVYRMQMASVAEKNRILEEENESLRQSILSKALQTANPDLRREHAQLRQTLDSYQSKINQMREISLITARIVDRFVYLSLVVLGKASSPYALLLYCSRIKTKQGRQYVEYKLQIETDIRGTLVLWHRYSTFLYVVWLLGCWPTSDLMVLLSICVAISRQR